MNVGLRSFDRPDRHGPHDDGISAAVLDLQQGEARGSLSWARSGRCGEQGHGAAGPMRANGPC